MSSYFFKIIKQADKKFYQLGLNIFDRNRDHFNQKPNKETGGFVYFEAKNIFDFLLSGMILCIIKIPENAIIIRQKDYFKADRIIIEDFLYLWDIETFYLLIQYGADVKYNNSVVLRNCCQMGNPEIVEYILQEGANLSSLENKSLEVASTYGHAEIVSLLIKRGAATRARNDIALFSASQGGHFTTVEILLKSGADPRTQGNRAYIAALNNSHFKVAKLLDDCAKKMERDESNKSACYCWIL